MSAFTRARSPASAARCMPAFIRSSPPWAPCSFSKGVEAAILAGVGNLAGALVGGIILGVTESIGSLFLPTAFRDAYGLVFLVAILLFRPERAVRGPEMSAAWLLVPLYMVPLVSHNEVLLTILIFTLHSRHPGDRLQHRASATPAS